GTRYPFFRGFDRWSRFPIRVGLDGRLGGYWNPAGYYDVYDVGSYATAGDLHGIVESVDYRRGTLVMRDDVSGSFVTVVMRGNDPRFGSMRQGDSIDLTGAWNRTGVFDAYNLPDVRGSRFSTPSRLDRSARSPSRLRITTSSTSAAAKPTCAPTSRRATGCTSPPTPAKRGRTSASKIRSRSERFSSIPTIRISCTSPPSDIRTPRTRSEESSVRATAARAGRKFSGLTMTPARSIPISSREIRA